MLKIKFIKNKTTNLSQIIQEVKEDQVLKRLDGKKFNKAIKFYWDNKESKSYLPGTYSDFLGKIKMGLEASIEPIPKEYKGEYLNWLITIVIKSSYNLERFQWFIDPVYRVNPSAKWGKKFYHFKKDKYLEKYLEIKSLNEFETFNDFLEKIKNAVEKYKEEHEPEEDLIFKNARWKVYIPSTKESAIKLGKGTKWCTSRNDDKNQYHYYHTKEYPLIIFISEQNRKEKYQFHYYSRMFNDKGDAPIDHEFTGDQWEFIDSPIFDELNGIVMNKLDVPESNVKEDAEWVNDQRQYNQWYEDGLGPGNPIDD